MLSKATRTQPKKKTPLTSRSTSVAKKNPVPKKPLSTKKIASNVQGAASQPGRQADLKRTSSPKMKKHSQPAQQDLLSSDLQVGSLAPAFSLPDDTGKIRNSSELRGKKVVLFFYPKDDTPGCTTEACSFRDGLQHLRKKSAVVFGVSADSVLSHRKFSEKYRLNFPLLSDESKALIQAYGVWKEKSLYGRKYMGIERTTIVINEDGTIKKIFPKVKVNAHLKEVLQALE